MATPKKKPSFSADGNSNIWKCNGCGLTQYVQAEYLCKRHGRVTRMGPQPMGVPAWYWCTGGEKNAGLHFTRTSKLTCTYCTPGRHKPAFVPIMSAIWRDKLNLEGLKLTLAEARKTAKADKGKSAPKKKSGN